MKNLGKVENVIFTNEIDFDETPFAIEFCDGSKLKITWDMLKNADEGTVWYNDRSLIELDNDPRSDFYRTEVKVKSKSERYTLIEYHHYSEFHKDIITRDAFIW